MKTIFKIFKHDLKKLFTNSMAVILVIGITILPSLYAWINIYANWDPYGSTGNMQVAVINSDLGSKIEDIEICVGDEIVSNLKANDSIDWCFVSKENAVEGVRSGEYYAAVEIPENFSSSLTSIVKSKFIQPQITYYANEKKNAIATKITDNVVTTVQTQVNESFVSTVVDVLSEVFGIISEDVSVKDDNLFEQLTSQISAAKESINGLETTVAGFAETSRLINELGKELNDTDFSSVGNHAENVINSTEEAVNTVHNSLMGVVDSAGTLIADIDKDVDKAIASVKTAQDKINSIKSDETLGTVLNDTYLNLTTISEKAGTASDVLSKMNSSLPIPLTKVNELIVKLNTIKDLSDKTAGLVTSVINSNNTPADLSNIISNLNNISDKMNGVLNDYKKTAQPQIENTVSSLTDAFANAADMISLIDDDKEKMNSILMSLEAATTAGSVSADSFQALLKSVSDELNILSKNITNLSNNESFNTFMNILKSNSNEFGAFLACPVSVETDKVYEIKNYGSAMAPFYRERPEMSTTFFIYPFLS